MQPADSQSKMIAYIMLLVISACHPGCIHDKIIRNQKLITINDSANGRRLQTQEYGPIRFYTLYNTTDVDPTTSLGQNIVKMMNIVLLYWQRTIEVYYAPTLSFNLEKGKDPSYATCRNFLVPRSLIQTPISKADYGIFIQAKNDSNNGVTAWSYPCASSMTTKQPLWGLLHWNIFYFAFDALSFQMNIKIGIHEVTHLLGFSSILYPNYQNGRVVTRGQFSYINGSFMQKALAEQYGCTTYPGMLLESGGGQITSMSHWSYKAAYNEYMTAGVQINNPTISLITLALLEETGWYKSIFKTYGQRLNWGYQKGCAMLDPNNCTSNEYCTQEGVKTCDYDQTALGYCKNDSFSSCLLVKIYYNYICADPNFATKGLNSLLINVTGEAGGQYSRCFSSTLVLRGSRATKFPFRCYTAMCSASGKTLTVKVGNKYSLCVFPGQNITLPGYDGYLICPTSFSRVCAIKRCPNECNTNGVCLNGRCLCSPNYTGDDCSKVTSVGLASQNMQAIFLAKDNDFCGVGTYLDTDYGDCLPCMDIKCAKCNEIGCISCLNGNIPSEDGC